MKNNRDCGHDHDHEHDHDDEPETISFTLDDGTEATCEILGTFEMNDINYIVLMPEDDEDVLIYRYKEEGEEISLEAIESDEEFEAVSEAFDELFGEEDEDDEDEDDDDEEDEDDDEDDDFGFGFGIEDDDEDDDDLFEDE